MPVAAWLGMGLFLLGVGALDGLCTARGRSLPGGALLLLRCVSLTLTWNWLEQECRPCRQTFPLDMGMFIYLIGIFLIPYYLWRNQRGWGALKLCALAALWFASYVLSVGVAWGLELMSE